MNQKTYSRLERECNLRSSFSPFTSILINAEVGNSINRHKPKAINDDITKFVIVPVMIVVVVM